MVDGAIDRETMLGERPEVENRITKLFERMGLKLERNPSKHAGGKMVWRYPSALGNQGNIEVDINFMYRIPLVPTQRIDSITMAGKQVTNLQVLDIHELAAGKLTALLERQTGRDFFDANELFKYDKMNYNKLRNIFVLYAAMCSKKNLLVITIDDINVNNRDLKNKLIPVMQNNFQRGFTSIEAWTEAIVNNVRRGFDNIFPFTPAEAEFIHSAMSGEGIYPEKFISSESRIDFNIIKKHPALLWATSKNYNH